MNHMMIDLETFGVQHNCVVLSAGIVVFRDCAPFDASNILHKEYHKLSVSAQVEEGRVIEAGTLRWWLDPTRIGKIPLDGEILLGNLLRLISGVWEEFGCKRVWSHGATFDLMILQNAAGKRPLPWKYHDMRDTRTLYEVFKVTLPKNSHDALEDAVNQTVAVLKCWDILDCTY